MADGLQSLGISADNRGYEPSFSGVLTESAGPRSLAARGVLLTSMAWCVLVLVVHSILGFTTCGLDTSYCAQGRDKNGIYRGVLLDVQGRSLPSSPFAVTFESRRGLVPREVHGFTTDAAGVYCIVWAQERVTPFVNSGDVQSSVRDPWQPLNGAAAPAGCQSGDQDIPWNRSDDLDSSAPFLAVPATLTAAVVLLLAALLLSSPAAAARARVAGLALTIASTVLAGVVWLV